MTNLNRLPNENEEQFIWRLGQAYDAGELDLNWEQIGDIINKEFRGDDSSYRDSSAYRKAYQSAKRFLAAGVFQNCGVSTPVVIHDSKARVLQKERIKLSTEKLEYNRWLREDARDEMLAEKFADAIRSLTPLEFPKILPVVYDENHKDKTGILVFGDEHFGAEFKIPGLRGEIINEYSPEIFYRRMTTLLEKTKEIIRREDLSEIRVYSLGDSTDGLLRVGQLMKLRYGVVEQAVKYANYIANWLNEMSKFACVKFQMVFGNHTELRFFNQKKGSFKDENTGKFIREIIRARLEGNPNFEMIENPTGLIYDVVQDYTILGIHGECKNMGQAIREFSIMYGTNINILIGGHTHHMSEETVGFDKEVITIPSIIGVDDYALSLNKSSRPGASFVIVKKGEGVALEHRIKL